MSKGASNPVSTATGGGGKGSRGRVSGQAGGGGKGPASYDLNTGLAPFNADFANVKQTLQGNADLLGPGDNPNSLYNQWGDIAAGNDPLVAMQRKAALGSAADALAARGISGGAAIGTLSQINNQYDMTALTNRNQALNTQAGLLGQQGQTLGDILQGDLAAPTLGVAATAAQNAGRGGGGGGKK